jgi:hypothetical protein
VCVVELLQKTLVRALWKSTLLVQEIKDTKFLSKKARISEFNVTATMNICGNEYVLAIYYTQIISFGAILPVAIITLLWKIAHINTCTCTKKCVH